MLLSKSSILMQFNHNTCQWTLAIENIYNHTFIYLGLLENNAFHAAFYLRKFEGILKQVSKPQPFINYKLKDLVYKGRIK